MLVELLDRQFAYFFTLKGTPQLGRLPRLLSFLNSDHRIAQLLQDFELEASKELMAYERADKEIRRKLTRLWRKHRAEIDVGVSTTNRDVLFARGNMEGYEARLTAVSTVVLPDRDKTTDRERETDQLIRSLSHWTKCITDRSERDQVQSPPAILALSNELSNLLERHSFLCRRLQEAGKWLPWAAYSRLLRDSSVTNPEPPRAAGDARSFTFTRDLAFASALRRADDAEISAIERHDVDVFYESIDADARVLYEEMRHRIGLGRSRLAVIQRYAARCEGFDAAELRKMCVRDSKNAERHLTLHLARYVFDHGLLPLIDPTICGLRPDVLHLGAGEPLYVEAKQYGDRNARPTILRAYAQVWSTWSRLRKLSSVTEAFLLVFRRGGPLVRLPESLRHEGLTLRSILVDISLRGGSREKEQVLQISEADLLQSLRKATS